MHVTRTRLALRVTGVVQGVGFRPYVHRLASELGLDGHVGNDAAGVFIEVVGAPDQVAAFRLRLPAEAPPLARIDAVTDRDPGPGARPVGPPAAAGFTIVASPPGGAAATLVPPDVGICDACRRELLDPTDRRYRHPFITCTDCGPRFTIIQGLPYDRPATTMAGFPMCPRCAAEYRDPTDRRFHAQPIACPGCGPTLRYVPAGDDADADDAGVEVVGTEPALAAAQACLRTGGVLAVKGVGGFHLACDATSPAAVTALRRRKRRPDRPFAVMARDLEVAQRLVRLGEEELAALRSPQRPIVLAARRSATTSAVCDVVAPGNPLLGVMLPSSPLHELLFHPRDPAASPVPDVLVMTSGNLASEPICHRDDEVGARLGPLVDAVLTHDRPIHVPCDDGVVRLLDGHVVPLRRSRGDAPLPLRLPVDAPPLLAVGGELKNTVGVAAGRQAWLSQHVGDLGSLATQQTLERTIADLTGFLGIDPEVVVADPHPGYASHAWARRHHRERLTHVQHHHAHVAALLAEHGVAPDEAITGAAFDGTGYGDDGCVWGGEVLVADLRTARRAAHLVAVPLPGGDAAVTNPARMALAHLWAAGLAWDPLLPAVAAVAERDRRLLRTQLDRDVACVPTTSMGRLLDAVSALLGICLEVTYEGQAAIELEWAAAAAAPDPTVTLGGAGPGLVVREAGPALVLDPGPLLAEVIDAVRSGEPAAPVAARVHAAVADAVVVVAVRLAESGGPRTVGLTGGVFQNAWLTTRTRTGLERAGLTVLTHQQVPPNDGGLALGQLAVAAARAAGAVATPPP